VESAFEHIGGGFRNASAFTGGDGRFGWKSEDLRVKQCLAGWDAQRYLAGGVMFPWLDLVFAPGYGDGVVLRFAEEVAQADSEDAADALEGLERGNHVIGFELGKEGGGEACLRRQPAEGEVLRGAKRTELQSDGVNG